MSTASTSGFAHAQYHTNKTVKMTIISKMSLSTCLGFCAEAAASHENGAQGGEADSVGYDRPDHAAVFDLSMEYSDDDILLDWEQYAGSHMHQLRNRSCIHGCLSLSCLLAGTVVEATKAACAGGRKFTFLGQDVTWLAKLCPWCPCWIPPEW